MSTLLLIETDAGTYYPFTFSFVDFLQCVDGEVSFAAAEKIHQWTMKKDEDLRALNAQIMSLQVSDSSPSFFLYKCHFSSSYLYRLYLSVRRLQGMRS